MGIVTEGEDSCPPNIRLVWKEFRGPEQFRIFIFGPCLPTIPSQTMYEDDVCLVPILGNMYIVQPYWPVVNFAVLSAMWTNFSRQ